jgi:hypothetical protein
MVAYSRGEGVGVREFARQRKATVRQEAPAVALKALNTSMLKRNTSYAVLSLTQTRDRSNRFGRSDSMITTIFHSTLPSEVESAPVEK